MSFWDWFRPRPKPPVPRPVKAQLQIWVFDGATGAPINNAPIDVFTPEFPAPEDGRTNEDGFWMTDVLAGHTHVVEVHADGYASISKDIFVGSIGHSEHYQLERIQPPAPVFVPRTGVVRHDRRSVLDDGGPFYPLGNTLFWALSGYQHERARLEQNLAFLQDHRFDFYRGCGDLDWAGQDASAPDFESALAGLVDLAYDKYGLRTQITAFAGPSPRDPLMVAQKVRSVALGRMHKIMLIEGANENAKSGPADVQLFEMIKIFHLAGITGIAGSTPMGENDTGQWDSFLTEQKYMGATVDSVHLDRATGDDDWRFVRQSWDFRGRPLPGCNNEGKGPRSSVAETTNVPRLVMYRAVSILSGLGRFVLHNGAGVSGKVDPAHNRPANLWEVPGIDDIMRALRNLDTFLPVGIENWQKTTQHGGWAYPGFENFGQPLSADGIWSDGHDHGCSRCYGAVNGLVFVTMVYGIKDHVMLRNERGVKDVKAYDAVTGEVVYDGQVGTSFRLDGRGGTEAAYIVIGHM